MDFIKPKMLKKGDTIGFVAPSGILCGNENLEHMIYCVKKQGFKVIVGDSCGKKYGYLSGTDKCRADDVNRMFADDRVDAVLSVRGGYGVSRILDMLDYDLIRSNPKIFSGYSDITALHIAINRICRMVTFHGPTAMDMEKDTFNGFTSDSYFRTVMSDKPVGLIKNPAGREIMSLTSGTASGKLVGGSLSLVAALLGTPYEIDTKGSIIFLEDTGEDIYRIDRMLTQLRLAGKFNDCSAIILGDFLNSENQTKDGEYSLLDVYNDVIVPCGKPTIYNVAIGHCPDFITVPMGVEAVVNADKKTFEITESPFKD